MQTWIALLRGINVVGKNLLPMKLLAGMMEELGCHQVRTYIQSGNVVFQSRVRDAQRLRREIGREILRRQGFEPQVLLLTVRQLEKAVAANPFPEAAAEPKSLHLFFLAERPRRVDRDALEKRRAESERFKLHSDVFYLHAPEGFGRSKLAAKVERLLGVAATARNWRTAQKLVEMVRQTR